jgi:flavin-binding protein dodecin
MKGTLHCSMGLAVIGSGTEDEIRMLRASGNGMRSCPPSEAGKKGQLQETCPQNEQEASSSPRTFVLVEDQHWRALAEPELWQEDFMAKQRKQTGPRENSTPDQQADTVYKIVDVVGVSETSWEDAGRNAVETAAGSLRDLRVAEVTKMDMRVENGKVAAFRTRVSLSFKYEA